jgi:hypothetical protein
MRKAKRTIIGTEIEQGEIYEFREKAPDVYEVRRKGEEKFFLADAKFIREEFEEASGVVVTRKGLLTALKIIARYYTENPQFDSCKDCDFYSEGGESCCLDYCIFKLANRAKLHIQAGDR